MYLSPNPDDLLSTLRRDLPAFFDSETVGELLLRVVSQRKPEQKRVNIGVDQNSGGLPGMPSHARPTATSASLPDKPTVSQFKAASLEEKMRWIKAHPGENPVPNPPKGAA
jgi:hypothetical protein